MKNIILTAQQLFFCFLPIFMVAQEEVQPQSINSWWNNVTQEIATTPYGHKTAINCHNCYDRSKKTLTNEEHYRNTLSIIHKARQNGADLIELDIVEVDEVVRISRRDGDDIIGADFKKILEDEALREASQMLFIEIKEEKDARKRFMWYVLNDIKNLGYAKKGRPVVLRCFEHEERFKYLEEAQQLVNSYFSRMKAHVKFSALINPSFADDPADFQARIKKAADKGFHIVELNYNTKNLLSHIAYAKQLGLGVALWSIPEKVGNIFLTALRDEVDIFSVSYDVQKARDIVEDKNTLFYLNAYHQDYQQGGQLTYFEKTATPYQLPLNHRNIPTMEHPMLGKMDFGSTLTFKNEDIQFLQSQPYSNPAKKGVLAAVVVKFDNLDLKDGERQVIMEKSLENDFVLELINPDGNLPVLLRFGVKVGRQVFYSFYPAEKLNEEESYLLVGAYDADGSVELWINQETTDVRMAHTRGGIQTKESPIVLGNGAENKNAGFAGKIQLAVVQIWEQH